MNCRVFTSVAILAAALLGSGFQLEASHPEIAPVLQCQVEGDIVELSWNIQFFAQINGWIVSRDGEEIAHLRPEANGYRDVDVPDGQHLYGLVAINFDNTPMTIGSCTVAVPLVVTSRRWFSPHTSISTNR